MPSKEEADLAHHAAILAGILTPGQVLNVVTLDFIVERLRALDIAPILAQSIMPVYPSAPRFVAEDKFKWEPKPAKPRRWLVEDDPGGFVVRDGNASLGALHDCRLIREIKPVTEKQVVAIRTKLGITCSHIKEQMQLLRELGIEVEE